MPRRSAPDFATTKYDYTNIRLDRTAIHLIALLVADKQLKYAYKKYGLEYLMEVSTEVEDWEIVQMTVELATGYRLIHWNSKYHEKTFPVGDLWPDITEDISQPLTVLEACNKIIHATELEFSTKKVRGFPLEYVEPFLGLAGAKGKKKWEAHIDMLRFCNEVLARHSNFEFHKSAARAAPGAEA